MLIAFVRLGRPKFLVGGFVMFGLGAAIAARSGHATDVRLYVLGQLVVTAFQWMTHYANDYYDYDADRANGTPTRWSGGSRVLATHVLPRRIALDAARVLALGGVVATIALARLAEPWTVPIVAAIFALAWEYSAPPLRLCATGTGELATALVVTGLVPLLGFYVQAPDLHGVAALAFAVVPLALLQLAMSIAIELPDAAGDAATGKRTLVVRLGASRSRWLYRALTTAALLALLASSPWIAIAIAPLAIWRILDVGRAAHEPVALFAVLLFVATAIAELVASSC